MASKCTKCGGDVPTGVAFCASCGASLPGGQGGTPAGPGIAPSAGGAGRPGERTVPAGPLELMPALAGGGASGGVMAYMPGAPGMGPPGFGGGPPGMPGGPAPGGPPFGGPRPGGPPFGGPPMGGPPGMAPRGGGSSTGLKVGCGIAGCLGVLLVVGIVVVAIFFMAGKSQSSHAASEGPPESGPSTGGPSTTGTSTGASRDVPSSGSLRDIIPQQVGDYRLQTIQPMTGMGSGVVDALSMVYFTPSGVRANHIVVVFSAAALAEAAMKETTQVVLGKFPGEVKAFAVRNKDNEQVGSGNQILANPESILWTHGKLMATVTTAPGRTEAFYNGVNY